MGNMVKIPQEYNIVYHKNAKHDNTVDLGLLPDINLKKRSSNA
jgi:hypothetical protein